MAMPKPRLRDMTVRDYMSREPVTGTPDDPISEILGKMKAHDIHEIPLITRKKLVGTVSMGAIARRRAPPATKAKTLAEKGTELRPEMSLTEASELLLSAGLRSLPVTQKGKLVGILSRSDVVRALSECQDVETITVDQIMTPQPQCVGTSDTIQQARSVMTHLGERAVPVVDKDRRLVGVVGIKDIVGLFSRDKDKPWDLTPQKEAVEVEIGSIMKDPIAVGPNTALPEALRLMAKHRISTIIVDEDRAPIGIVTTADLVELAARQREREGLLVQISGLEEQPDVYEQMYSMIQRGMRRIAGLVTPRLLNIHVHQYKAEGDKAKWSLRARFATDHEMYHLKHFDWDLFKALDGLLQILEGLLKKDKDRRIGARKRRRS